jgi:hypothetical protein
VFPYFNVIYYRQIFFTPKITFEINYIFKIIKTYKSGNNDNCMLVVNWCKIIFYMGGNRIYRHNLMVNYALMFFSKVILSVKLFSLFISQKNVSLLANFMKFIQLSVMHWIKLSLSLCKALHVRRKCNSSSTSLLEHLGHVLLCRGLPRCLPFSILGAKLFFTRVETEFTDTS